MTKVIVIGAGIVGSACAYFLARAGFDVGVVDRGQVGAGTTSHGEGNLLLSDKVPGPELELMQLSRTQWLEIGDDLGSAGIELQPKGGLVAATSDEGFTELARFAGDQAAAGIEVEVTTSPQRFEPNLDPDLAGGVVYPEDLQVQPVLAANALLRAACGRGARFHNGQSVTGLVHDHSGAVVGVETTVSSLEADMVVNAAGTWGGDVGDLLGTPIPVLPRRGFVLVTEPLPRVVRRKVYSADYVSNIVSSSAGLETSCVVEGTRGGTVLIGASRERVGYDTTVDPDIVATLATQAIRLFPMLSDVALLRVYRGFRPYCPDHLPVIGTDVRVPGVYHACGHEGAGVGLSAGTGYVISRLLAGEPAGMDVAPFAPSRFGTAPSAETSVGS